MTRCLILATLAGLLSIGGGDAADLPKRYALVVGVNEYKHPKLQGRPLKFAVADATSRG